MLGLGEVDRPVSLRKRDGRLVAFELDKIGAAIEAAGLATGEFEPVTAQALAAQVLARMPQRVVAVEQAQDAVERVLMEAGYYDTARRGRTSSTASVMDGCGAIANHWSTSPRR